MVGRHAERDAGVPDLPLRADEPLGHRRLGDEKRAGDLGRAEAAERPQRERDLRVDGERGMAAREHELEPLVGEGGLVHGVLHSLGHPEQVGLRGQRAIAADAVEGPVARGRDEPRAGTGGDPVSRPALCGDRERLLRGFLGEIEVAEEADECGEDVSPLRAEDLVEVGYHSTTGRTSMAPPSRAAGIRAASSIAASRSSASKMR